MAKKLKVIHVHGTWADDATWVRPDSRFSKAISENIPGITGFEAPRWSGRNSFKARIAAGNKIVHEISKVDSDTKVVICAHSHGGNAVASALRIRPQISEKIDSAVFLATPFLTYRLMPTWRVVFEGISAPIVAFFLLALSYVLIHLGWFIQELVPENLRKNLYLALALQSILFVIFAEIAMQFLVCFNKAKLKYASRFLKNAIRTGDRLTSSLPPSDKFMFVRLSGDEAASSLSFLQGLSWLILFTNVVVGKLMWLLSAPIRIERIKYPVKTRMFLIPFALVFPFALLVFVGAAGPLEDLTPQRALNAIRGLFSNIVSAFTYPDPGGALPTYAVPILGTIALFYCVIITALYILPMAFFGVSACLYLLNWLVLYLFGVAPFLASGVLQPAVEAIPAGNRKLLLIDWRSYGPASRGWAWRHSNPYQEPRVISSIVEWLKR